MSVAFAWAGMAIAFLGVIWGKLVISGAATFVKAEHPEAFAAMSDYGTPVLKNFSPEDGRVRRALAAKLLTGSLPAGLASDERVAVYSRNWRRAVGAIVLGFAITGLAMWGGYAA